MVYETLEVLRKKFGLLLFLFARVVLSWTKAGTFLSMKQRTKSKVKNNKAVEKIMKFYVYFNIILMKNTSTN